MTISVLHAFVSGKANSADTTMVRPVNWNDDHDVTSDNAGFVVGRVKASAGNLQELPLIYDDVLHTWEFNSTGSLLIPHGSSAQRPGSPEMGEMRWNSTTNTVEVYGLDGQTSWQPLPSIQSGTIIIASSANAKVGYLLCNGARYDRTDYAALYAEIADTWDPPGTIDDHITFAVPNLVGLVLGGADNSGAVIGTAMPVGKKIGGKTVTLVANNIPPHTHPVPSVMQVGSDIVGGAGSYLSNHLINDGTSGASTGTSAPVSVVQPTAGVNFWIKI